MTDGQAGIIGKIVPAALAPHLVERPRVWAHLAEATRRRVAVLTAGPGFGKTTALTTFAAERNCAWYTVTAYDRDPVPLARGLVASLALRVPGLVDTLGPAVDGARGPSSSGAALASDVVEAFVPTLVGALQQGSDAEVVLVLDDLHELDPDGPAMRLVSDLCHMAPRRLRVVLASRTDVPFPVERLRLQGQLYGLGPEVLGFDGDETAALLDLVGGPDLRPYAPAVADLTGGWPAAVRLVAEALSTTTDRDRLMAGLLDRGGAADLVSDLLGGELAAAPAGLVALLRAGAAVDAFNAELLAVLDVPDAAAVLGAARRRGIHIVASPRDGWFALTPMSREYALARLLPDPAERVRRLVAAAGWHTAHGDPATALRYLSLAGDAAGVVALVEAQGSALLAAGHGPVVGEALAKIPDDLRTPVVDLVEGEACQIRGDWDRAVACLGRLIPEWGPAPAAAAWRLGLIHHMRGEPERAIVLYRRGHADPRGADGDRALAAAWGAAAAWLTGDAASCRELAATAAELAEAAGDARALAATHTALAMLAALDGDRRSNDMHYLRALDHAERAGDVLQTIRIRANRGSRFLEEGYYAEAVAELGSAIGLADLAGFAALQALALQNRGDALRRLGRLDEAARDLQAALAIQQRIGSRMASYAIAGLGGIHADQGNASLARAAYEEALALAEPTGDLQGLVPALCGLARALTADEPDLAAKYVDRALACGPNLAQTEAHLAAGWLALRMADEPAARDHAAAASEAARRRRDRAAVAESLELRATAEPDRDRRCALLAEAEALWDALGSPLPLARTRIALHQAGGGAGTVALAEIERTCRRLGARALATAAAAAASGRPAPRPRSAGPARPEALAGAPSVSVRTLGGFRVLRDGTAVPPGSWQSRKARDVLRILIARRGAPIPRDALCGLLWPQVEPRTAAKRLSVAVSTLRAVLDPDHAHPSDHYVATGDGALWLRREQVEIDVENFLAAANAALSTEDIDALEAAEAVYSGDFCEEDRQAEWARPLRHEARAVYVAVARRLAQRHAAAGSHETAARYLLRLLAGEPYDEQAYLMLVAELDAAGQHGEARRVYRTYAAHMSELGVEQAPYPSEPSVR